MKIQTHKTLPLTALLLSACASSPFDSWDSKTSDVDETLLAYVDEDGREQVIEARNASSQKASDIAVARGELKQVQGELELAEAQVQVAEEKVDNAKLEVEVAQQGSNDDVQTADTDLRNARANRRWVEAQRGVVEREVQAAKAKIELAEMEAKLAEARLEWTKATAISELDRPEVEDMELEPYERKVDQLEARVQDLKVDLEAAQEKVRIAQGRSDELEKAVGRND